MKEVILMRILKMFIVSCIITGMSISSSFSQEEEEKEKAEFTYKEIVVKEKREQANTVSIITDEEVEKSTKSDLIGVINENVPSFYTGNRGVLGYGVAASQSARMTIRGMGLSSWGPTTGFPILFNGIDTTATVWSHPVADIFSMKNIERVEVFHGPQPVLFGSTALAGAINVVTKRQEKEGYQTLLSASYGSYNTTDDYIHHMGKIGILDYGVSYNYMWTDGHREEEIDGKEYTSQYRSNNGTARIGLQMGENFYASLTGYVMDMNIHDPGPENRATDAEDLEIFDILRSGVSLSIHNSFKILEGYIQAYSNQGTHEATNPVTNEKWYKHVDSTRLVKLQETLQKIIPGNRLTVGFEYKKYGGEIKKTSGTLMDEEYLIDHSVYGLMEQQLGFIILSGGARYTDNSEYGGYTAYQGGVIINPTKTTKIYASAARGFTIPGIRYRYNPNAPGGFTDENADLDPEINIVYEAGIEQTLLKILTVELIGYQIHAENKIIPVFSPPPPKFDNSESDIEYNGMEASLKLSFKGAGLRASYSYIDHEYDDKDGEKQILSYVPKHKAVFGGYVEFWRLIVSVNGEYVKTIWHDYSADEKLDNYLIFNAKIAFSILEGLEAFVNLNNISDEEYATFIRDGGEYTMPGFHVLGGASAVF